MSTSPNKRKRSTAAIINSLSAVPARQVGKSYSSFLSSVLGPLTGIDFTPATRSTWVLRSEIIHGLRDAAAISQQEMTYIDSKWSMYDELLKSSSASELLIKIGIYQPSFMLVDYLVLFLGFSHISYTNYGFKTNVLLKIIDAHHEFDDAMKTPRFMRLLMKMMQVIPEHKTSKIRQVIAHILVKFPELKKMNFMFIKSKNKKPRARFSEEEIRENF